MKKIFISFCILFTACYGTAQTADAKELQQTAKTFMKQGDFANAVLVLNRALQLDPKNTELSKDLALSYYFQKDNAKAIEAIKPVLETDDVDDQSFQIAGSIYKAQGEKKDAEKIYKKGIRKFPGSGTLYNELGELLQSSGDYTAIKQWEKGIEQDPSYSKNYYNAAKYYFLTVDKVWSIVYGEVFINMEPLGNRTPEVKEMLLESYKKLFADADLEQNGKDKSIFAKAFLQSMNKQSSLASMGINAESLTMIRTRFILDWNNSSSTKFPYQLFDYQRQLLQDGMFDAYNQWIFGPSQNLSAFQNWVTTHSTEYSGFSNFQKGRVFKIPAGQYYH